MIIQPGPPHLLDGDFFVCTMSRGLGKTQRAILDKLLSNKEHKMPLSELVRKLSPKKKANRKKIIRTTYASISRACKTLEEAGFIRKKMDRTSEDKEMDKFVRRMIEAGLADKSDYTSQKKIVMIELVKRKKKKKLI